MDPIQSVRRSVEKLEALPRDSLSTAKALLLEGRVLASLRLLLSIIPNRRLKESEIESYFHQFPGVKVSDELIEFAISTPRRKRLSIAEENFLCERQNQRCGSCGVFLDRDAEVNVDHIHPISFGGRDEVKNMQLLCKKCNIGKGDSIHWTMLSPFFNSFNGHDPSLRLKYSAYRRFRSACCHTNCSVNARQQEMYVAHRVPLHRGGRNVFDNLQVLCQDHWNQYLDSRKKTASSPVRRFQFKVSKSSGSRP